MKNIIHTIILSLTISTIYNQDFDYLKKRDTIYIEFKGNENEKKYSIQTRIHPTNFDERAYNLLYKISLVFILITQNIKTGIKKREMLYPK